MKIDKLLLLPIVALLIGCDGGSSSSDTKDTTDTNSYKVLLHIPKDKTLVAYDTKFKFKSRLPSTKDITLKGASLAINGRTVSSLGPKSDTTKLILSFGAWSKGSAKGASGDIEVMRFKSKDLAKDITVIGKNFVYASGKSDSSSTTISIEKL